MEAEAWNGEKLQYMLYDTPVISMNHASPTRMELLAAPHTKAIASSQRMESWIEGMFTM